MNDITLRKLESKDLEMVRKWRNSEGVYQYMYTDAIITCEQHSEWFNKKNEDQSALLWIIGYEGKDIGLASISEINRTFNSCYWAFYLGDTSIRGAGIGSKVEYNVIEYVFNELGLNKLRCEVFVSNSKVIQMHEKFGFRREAYYRQHICKNGEYQDVVGLALLKSEWAPIKSSMEQKIYTKK